ncbi:DUF6173 family protein [Halalkalibacterium ligniniphilum]|uniref:DUF6173 family protein n=1 Tax=Halalkalibacterium ligniniphilum TaxID=1134413 RepID=UPI00034940F7|nr:DUF6173 family protein [Halalkalibacterium ligniniphilum]
MKQLPDAMHSQFEEFEQVVVSDPHLASDFYERLIKIFRQFDESLDHEHEVGLRLVSFGQTMQFHVEAVGYYNPSLIRFYGHTGDGTKVELVQHVSQLNFLLMAVKRLHPEQRKKSIGFSIES